MAISGVYSNILRPQVLINKARQFALNACGGRNRTYTLNNPKVIKGIEWIGKEISSPENRLILGVTALMSQPFIDAKNPTLDDNVKGVVIARTVAKILVGTTTGVIIRKGCIKALDYMTTAPEKITATMKHQKLRQLLYTPNMKPHYKEGIGTLVALGVMLFTNFLIDAPGTQLLTNIFVKNKYKNGGDKNAKSK